MRLFLVQHYVKVSYMSLPIAAAGETGEADEVGDERKQGRTRIHQSVGRHWLEW